MIIIGYSTGSYCWLLYRWLLLTIILVVIAGYCIGAYCWPLYW
jgi:hypothetical protein